MPSLWYVENESINIKEGTRMEMINGLLLFFIGLFSGAYGVIVGAGGGFIFVPALLLIFKMSPPLAAGTGLTIVLINSLSGTIGYIRQKRIDYKLGAVLALGAAPGTFIGAKLSHIVSPGVFYGAFAVILVALGVFLFIKNSPRIAGQETRLEVAPSAEVSSEIDEKPPLPVTWLLVIGLIMGIVANFFGIGGGWLLVPILIYVFKVAPHQATATSLYSLSLYSFVGVLIQLFHQQIDWMAALWGGLGVMIGAQLGVALSNKLPGKVIIQMLSILLVGVGMRLMFT